MSDDILLIDKPSGWTSFDVVAKIRSQIRAGYRERGEKPTKRQLRVGHAGTLDPFATGLLIVLLGDACKRAGEFLKLDKVYEATITLGATSTTGDPEGVITETRERQMEDGKWNMANHKQESEDNKSQPAILPPSNSHLPIANLQAPPTLAEVQSALEQFIGEITQIPPSYSAIKVNGQRAYKLAREGKVVDVPPRQVMIYSIDLLEYEYPTLKIRTHVGSGTYIRTLAEDIGAALGTGAYCSALRRIRVGEWDIQSAKTVPEVLLTE